MNNDSCKTVRERLAGDGIEAAGLPEIASHLEGCADCTSFLEALRRAEGALGDLSMPDAPDALVARTLHAVRDAARDKGGAAGAGGAPTRPGARDRWYAAGLAASVLVATIVGLNTGIDWLSYKSAQYSGGETFELFDSISNYSGPQELGLDLPSAESEPSSSMRADDYQSKADEGASLAAPPADKKEFSGDYRVGGEAGSVAGAPVVTESEEDSSRERDVIALLDAENQHRRKGVRSTPKFLERGSESAARLEPNQQLAAPSVGRKAKNKDRGGALNALVDSFESPLEERSRGGKTAQADGDLNRDQLAESAEAEKRVAKKPQASAAQVPNSDLSTAPVGGGWADTAEFGNERRYNRLPTADPHQALATQFLARHRSLDGLSFQEPVGYWANTYIPGDPAMRLLGAQLRGWNRAMFGLRSGFEQEVRPVRQPFDAPRDAALAIYLDADAPAIDGPTRLRIQVGLKGADRQGGRRPAMNVGLVVDLRGGADPAVGARIRALISALEQARQPEDRFSLIVAGPGGGLVTPPELFRHGPLRVAMDRMFDPRPIPVGTGVRLHEAVALATETVKSGDDPGAVLGSSLVILVTGSPLAGDLAALESMAHRNAVAGVPLSVVGLAAGEDPQQIERLVAAGQGNRRILDSAQAADGLIDRELHAASRAVARAVRLRIRLAPGVKLIDVLGSRRLAEPQAERVREAEQSIDRRLARNLGIRADRGEDEEGLQIVIPAFQAGDDHVVLLDVVVDKAGPVADVTARYKDVIHLKNGVARTSLTVGRGGAVAGPLELNVLKNLVAREYALGTDAAARYLAAGDPRHAVAIITALRDLIRGLRAEIAGWRSDPDLAADESLLNDYLAALASPAVADLGQRQYVAASLRYAAFRKLQPSAR